MTKGFKAEDDAVAADRWTRLVMSVATFVNGWLLRDGVVALRVTLTDAGSTLASCQVWAATPATAWAPRGDIVVEGFTLADLERAVSDAGFTFPRNKESRPRWRVDRNRGTTYTLDIVRPGA
ncbi:hypothetical protein GCM10028784_26300 [Myceligenerans cantabricum]